MRAMDRPDYSAVYNPAFMRAARERNAVRAAAMREAERQAEERRRIEEALRAAAVREAERQAEERRRVEEALLRQERERRERIANRKRSLLDALFEKRAPVVITIPRAPYITAYEKIEARISKATGVGVRDIRGSGRSVSVVLARMAVAYWTARLTGMSYAWIGNRMGGRDHTTILYSVQTYPKKRARQGRSLRIIRRLIKGNEDAKP